MKKFILGLVIGIILSVICLNTYNSKAHSQSRSKYMDIGDTYMNKSDNNIINFNWAKLDAIKALVAYTAAIAEKIECK